MNCQFLGQSSVFSSLENIWVMNINTKQLVAKRDKAMVICCQMEPRGILFVCRERITKKEYTTN